MLRAEKTFCYLMASLASICIMLVFAVVLAGSISRYVFSSPLLWSDDIAKYAMIFGTMFGIAYGYLQGSQINFGVVVDLLPRKARYFLEYISNISVLCLGVLLMGAGWIFAEKRGSILSSTLGIPMYWAQIAIMIGGICIAIAAIFRFAAIYRRKNPDQDALA